MSPAQKRTQYLGYRKMLYQDQTIFGSDKGNCLATCIANLLDLDINDVPNFLDAEEHWWKELVSWLADRGLSIICIGKDIYGRASAHWATCFCIACGRGPRGCRHAVVWKLDGVLAEEAGHMIHDPHPSHAGLIDEPDEFYFLVHNEPYL